MKGTFCWKKANGSLIQIGNFLQFFGNGPNEISEVKKKSLKKIKYRQSRGGFTFWPEVKFTRVIDMFSAVFSNQFFAPEANTLTN